MHWRRWRYVLPLRLRSLFRRVRVEEELDEELQFHLECRIARDVARGVGPADARRAAILKLDGLEQCKEECRDRRNVNMIENVIQDVRCGWRGLWKSPGFTIVAVLTLALGIGANSAIFSVINALLLRPLPYPRSNQLALLFEKDVVEGGGPNNVVSYAVFATWERKSHSFSAMAAGRQSSFNLGGQGQFSPERIDGAVYSWGLFKTLGVQPAIGRTLTAEDDRYGAHRVVVISHGLWQRRFAGARDILNRQVRLDGVSADIIGVMPKGFGYPARTTEVWVPIHQVSDPGSLGNLGSHQLYVIARLRDGVTFRQATADLDVVQQQLRLAYPNSLIGHGAVSLPLRDFTTRRSRTSLSVLLGAVGLLLLIACVNVSNLLFARGCRRFRELSMRAALGASRSRLVQQLLTESMLLAILGAAAGIVLALILSPAIGLHADALIQSDIDTSAPVGVDGWVLAFTAGLSLLAGITAGLIPARRLVRGDLVVGLKESGRALAGGRAQQRLRIGLVSIEIALSLVLLIAAGLLIQSFAQLQRVHPGLRTRNLLTARVAPLPKSRYNNREKVSQFAQLLLERLRVLPGVRSAGLVNCPPVAGYWGDNSFNIDGHPQPSGRFIFALYRTASPEYFSTAGIPLLAGRTFTVQDGSGFDDKHLHQSAVIISESMARNFWPQGNAVGQKIYFGDESSLRFEVIGIVGDVLTGLADRPQPTMYLPLLEGETRDFYAVLHTAGDPAALTSSVRRVISSLDSDVPASQIRTMTEILGQSAKNQALTSVLLSSFAALALALAAVGLYGVVSYLVSQRTAEIGIRMALGARRTQVCWMILLEGIRPAVLGLLAGSLAAVALTRTLRRLLFGVKPDDVPTYIVVAFLMIAVAVLASLVPAWRASRVDPADALRSE